MLMPKRVKYRKPHLSRPTGKIERGYEVSFGEYGLQALESGFISARQIEAARIAMTRYVKRGGAKSGLKSSPSSLSPLSRRKPAWAVVRALQITGWRLSNQDAFSLN
jgi:ribosomal protein L16/L10AE